MRQSSRLIFNVAVTYGRMTLGFVVGLLLTRQLLAELGEIEFGLFMSVGAAWGLLALFMVALQSSGQRHLAHCVGIGDDAATKQTFSSLCAANAIIGLTIAAIGLVLAEPLLGVVDIPPGREVAARCVYYLALTTLACSAALNPFISALLASQRFLPVTLFDLAARFSQLAAAYCMLLYPGDRLIYWAIAYTIIEVAAGIARSVYSWCTTPWASFSTSRVKLAEIKEILTFASWLLASTVIQRVRLQGTLLLFSHFYGNQVAAAQGVSMQLVNYQNQMSNAIAQPVHPVLAQQYARQDFRGFRRLTLLYSKFATIAGALIGIVLLTHVDSLLKLWLEKVPPYTASIAWFTLALFLFNKCTYGYFAAMQARREMRGVVLLVQLPELLSIIPIVAYLLIDPGPPWFVPLAFLIINGFLTMLVLPIYAGHRIGIPLTTWLRTTALPLWLLLGMAYAASASTLFLPIDPILQVCLALFLNAAVLLIGGWTIVIDTEDRQLLTAFVGRMLSTIRSRGKSPTSENLETSGGLP